MEERERRFCVQAENDTPIKIERSESETKIIGHAAIFNQLSQKLGYFREIIRPGFFKNALDNPDRILGLFNHDDNIVIGERNAKTLELTETSHGLKYAISVASTQTIKDLVLSPIERKEIVGASFGFSLNEDGYRWEESDDYDEMIRVLLQGGCAKLYDVGPVTFPAYTQTDTSVAARSLKVFNENQRVIEQEARKKEIENKILKITKG